MDPEQSNTQNSSVQDQSKTTQDQASNIKPENQRESGQPAFKKQKLDAGSLPDVSKIDLSNGLAVKNALTLFDNHLKRAGVSETDLSPQFSIDRAKLLKYHLKHTSDIDAHVQALKELGYNPTPVQNLNTEAKNVFFDYVAADATFRAHNNKKNEEKVKGLEEEVEKLKKERMPLREEPIQNRQESNQVDESDQIHTLGSDYLSAFHGYQVPMKKNNNNTNTQNNSSNDSFYNHIFNQSMAERGLY